MTSILVITGKSSRKQFKCNFLKSKKVCYQLFIPFLESTSHFQNFQKTGQADSSTVSAIIDSERSC